MVNDSDLFKKADIPYDLPEEVILNLRRYESKEEKHTDWDVDDMLLPRDEKILLVTSDKFALFENVKITESTLIWTTKRALLYGTEIRSTLVSSMVSREFERRRGVEKRSKNLEPLKSKGWSIPHDLVTRLEIIQLGKKFSLYFFDKEKRKYIINDVDLSDMKVIESFMREQRNIEINVGEFQIPLSDILILFIVGFFLLFFGWLIIVIIF